MQTKMSELYSFNVHFSTLLSDLILFCSFILSHPLYFSYFIFFSPYILKLISFLSPLLFTTFLVSLAFFTALAHHNFSAEFVQTTTSVLERLRPKKDWQNEELQCVEDLEMYEVFFGSSSMMEVKENPVQFLEEKAVDNPLQASDSGDLGIDEGFMDKKEEVNPVSAPKLGNSCGQMEERRLENFLKILDEFERMASNAEDKKRAEPSRGTKNDKVVEKQKAVRNGSEATEDKLNLGVTSSNGGKEHTPLVKSHSQRISPTIDHSHDGSIDHHNLGTYGSMRKEKEWKRTLACKLFEERHNVDGGEGMDSLWEAYEMDANKQRQRNEKSKKRVVKKREVEISEDEEIDGQLCCLQALKLSAGKMNLGMGRPNLVKITKAIKGIGWLHSVSKHSKKVHNNGDRY